MLGGQVAQLYGSQGGDKLSATAVLVEAGGALGHEFGERVYLPLEPVTWSGSSVIIEVA